MAIRCEKCRATIGKKSAFAVLMIRTDEGAGADIVRASTLKEGDVAIHVNGDTQCLRKVSGYIGAVMEKLCILGEIDMGFLDDL